MVIIQIIKKELNLFLGSWISYIVYSIFLLGLGLITWFFPDTNLLDYGFAELNIVFNFTPYLLLFLIPAIIMRFFSDEKKTGTLEILLTRPISNGQLVFGKFVAGVILSTLPLLPILLYYYTLYQLGLPEGNIDTAEFLGSYLGLFLLVCTFVAIGIFASSLTENQIIAFLLAVFLCFISFDGFDALARINVWNKYSYWVEQMGILNHYNTLSRGLIDLRDIIYFFGLILILLVITRWRISDRSTNQAFVFNSKKLKSILILFNAVLIIILMNNISSKWISRIDLTEEKRFTLSKSTKQLLSLVDKPIDIEIYLEGDMPSGFKRLKEAIKEALDELNAYANTPIRYHYIDPNQAKSKKLLKEFQKSLLEKGVYAKDVVENTKGERVQKRIFPSGLILLGNKEEAVNFLQSNVSLPPQEQLNQSIEGIEYVISTALKKLISPERLKIGLLKGHQELDSLEISSLSNTLLKSFDVYNVDITKKLSLSGYDCIIIAKPQKAFSVQDKYKIDQYIMNEGSVLFLLDMVAVNMREAGSPKGSIGIIRDLQISDLLFRYGVRINPDLIQDLYSHTMPVVTSMYGNKPNIELLPWFYFPLGINYSKHPTVRNMGNSLLQFASSIDTVKAENVVKTPLMFTSQNVKRVNMPSVISLNQIQQFNPNFFQKKEQPFVTGYLLEGKFKSLFSNRFLPPGVQAGNFKESAKNTRIIVISDGDIARNEINPKTNKPVELGYDPYTQKKFINQELITNMVNYLADKEGIIMSRNNQIIARPLDKRKVIEEREFWQWMNLIAPIIMMILISLTYIYFRHKNYAKQL